MHHHAQPVAAREPAAPSVAREPAATAAPTAAEEEPSAPTAQKEAAPTAPWLVAPAASSGEEACFCVHQVCPIATHLAMQTRHGASCLFGQPGQRATQTLVSPANVGLARRATQRQPALREQCKLSVLLAKVVCMPAEAVRGEAGQAMPNLACPPPLPWLLQS